MSAHELKDIDRLGQSGAPKSKGARPFVVGIGGALRANSSTEKALRIALRAVADLGAETLLLTGADLDLPMYSPERTDRSPAASRLVAEVRRADGVIVGSPGYHGGISGLVKNALDYVEDLRGDSRPYLDGRIVGAVATGAGWQGAVNTLAALRSIVHSLRGWNTPIGVAINTAEPMFDEAGECVHPHTATLLRLMGEQVAGAIVPAGR